MSFLKDTKLKQYLKDDKSADRRDFFKSVGKSILSLTGFVAAASTVHGKTLSSGRSKQEAWLDKIKGSHRIIYDATSGQEEFLVAWPFNFLLTNNQSGTPDDDLTVVVVLRHKAIALAFEDRIWSKYKLGKFFKISDIVTPTPAVRNPFWNPKEGEFLPGMSIKTLQERGVLYCACELAITKNSKMVALAMGLDVEEVRKDWMSGLLPGIQSVPAGVWALERAQQKGCAYCFAG